MIGTNVLFCLKHDDSEEARSNGVQTIPTSRPLIITLKINNPNTLSFG